MNDENECCGGHEGESSEQFALELGAASQFVLEMRAQNLELLKIAAQVAGFAGSHGPLKPGDLRNAMKGIWDVYSELYSWVDPEEGEDEDEEGEEE